MATIAEEQAANARARAEGYESAAHKEAAANFRRAQADPNAPDAAEYERQANIRAAQVTDPRTGAPFASASDMEAYANTQSQKVFNPATGAYFTSAADYEIDANRRAREAGYLNAADYESGLRTRVDPTKFPFIDPRTLPAPIIPEQFRSKEYAEERGLEGHANILKYNPDQPTLPGYDPNWRDNYPGGFDFHGNPITGGWIIDGGGILDGPPNPTVPSFGYPGYQDWSRFMPTNFQLAEGGGFHYQPWLTGGAGMGGGAGGFAGPDTWATGGGGTTGVPGVTYTPTNIWGDTTTGGNVTTDTSGKQWVMSPGGQWYPADSDYGEGLLGTGRLFYDQHYDSSGNYVGAEGTSYDDQGFEIDQQGRRTGGYINDPLGIGNKILGWMGAWSPEVQRAKAAHTAGLTADQSAAMAAANAAQAGTDFADMYGGADYEGADPTAAGFIDWDE